MLKQVLETPVIYRLTWSRESKLAANCYLLFSENELLVVDPPVKEAEACRNLSQILQEHQERYQTLRVVFTHLHGEGMGHLPACVPRGTDVYLCQQETLFASGEDPCQYLNRRYRREGYPSQEKWQCTLPAEDGLDWVNRIPVGEGDTISVGTCLLRCLYTPGHTLGHICLLAEEEGILFTGDAVLWNVMPRIGVWRGKISAVEAFLDSLERLKNIQPTLVLPGHGDCQGTLESRIEGMVRQSFFRLLELYQLVNDHPGSSAYALSQRFHHCGEDWSEATEKVRWNAMGETLAYLIYLRNCGYVSAVRGKRGIVNEPGNRRLTDT